jgi:hypothetical protein
LTLRFIAGIVILLITIPSSFAEDPMMVLCLGAVEGSLAPYLGWFRQEPSLKGHLVPARFYESGWSGIHSDRILRSVRMYFPRTYDEMTNYDFMMLDSPVVSYFGGKGIRWMRRSVEEGHSSATTMNSILSKHQFCFLPFLESELADVFPLDGIRVAEYAGGLGATKLNMKIGTPYSGAFHVRLNRDAPPVFSPFLSLGLEKFIAGGGYLMFAKPGAFVWMWSVGNHPNVAPETPYLMSWDYGRGLAWSLSDNFRHGWWGWDMPAETHIVAKNEYGLDILVNWIRYASGRDPIQDILEYHDIRMRYGYYNDLRNLVYSVIDFTSAFGGRTTGLELQVLEVDDLVAVSKDFFVRGELEESKQRIDLAVKGLTEITDDSIRLKDSTFFWIYLTQWLVVTATSMICGFTLWSLMIRRRAYREVRTTRTA